MRVTLISDEWRRNGGVASYLRRLAAALAAGGASVQVVHNDRGARSEPGVRDDYVPGSTVYDQSSSRTASSAREAVEAVEAFAPDVVHVQSCNNFTLEAALRARYRATKSLHVYDFCPSNTKYHHALERECAHATSLRCLPRLAYKRCTTSRRPSVWLRMQRRATDANRNNAAYHRVIVASEHVRRQAIATGYPPAQVAVVPYFVNAPAVEGDAEPRTILTAGRLTREKGFDLFIDALTHVPKPWRAIIAGDGMERAALEQRAARAGLTGDIDFAGWQDETGMGALYARASVVVMPSRWPEPSGIVGLEAMAHGRPVAAFAVGGIPEWLQDGVTGRLAVPGDSASLAAAIVTILSDPGAASAMGAAGRGRAVDVFSAARHLTALNTLYGRLPPPA
ncbi:MAG: glycosyltransferase family 4 protein [Acidobacteriota bacterium]|nr:glycosyltransferase family 4 protein [Acidobacteriota bacterium]